MIKNVLGVGLLLISTGVMANNTTVANVLPKTISFPGQPVFQLKTIQCPNPSDLTKDPVTNRWSALGLWKGTTQSLATKATKFLGAQWQGINLGQPFCIYHGYPAGTFDIVLAYHTFSVTPRAGKWQDQKHQIYKCLSHDLKDCLFQVRLKPKTLTIDQQLDRIKPNANSNSLNARGF